MELKEGMYVMTNDRMKIGQIKGFCTCAMCEERGFYEPIIDGDIIITAYDKYRGFHGYRFYDKPIDLIRPGDYVNGRLFHNELVWTTNYGWIGIDELEEKDITSIVTKEQFDSMKYEVE